MNIIIYTDGAAIGNPGPGGYGIVMKSGVHYKELSGAFKLTTNNRMELLAVIIALETIKIENAQVMLYTDSKYVHDAIEKKWVFGWEKKGFNKIKNPDLWKRFLKIYKVHHVKTNWVKGHNGNTLNERCDVLATEAAAQNPQQIDKGYIDSIEKNSLF